jgi:hypothetical protein
MKDFLKPGKVWFLLVFVFLLVLMLVWKQFENNQLKKKLAIVVNKSVIYERVTDSLNTNARNKELVIQIDNLILEALAKENSIGVDSLRASFVNLPVSMYKDIVEFRLSTEQSIAQNLTVKNQRIQQALKQVGNLISEYAALQKKYKMLETIKSELNENNRSAETINQRLRFQIDSVASTYNENLSVKELMKNGNSIYHIGSRIGGIPEGFGVGLWSTGGIYKGDWKNGLRDGHGTYVWKDGEVYEGEWKAGVRTGSGKYIWKDKYYYIGDWQDNKRHGFGTMYYPNGKIEYQGNWVQDKFKQTRKTN